MEIFEFLMKRNLATGLVAAVGTVLLLPVLVPAVARVGRPAAKAVVKTGILAYEGGRNAIGALGRAASDQAAVAGTVVALPAGPGKPLQKVTLPDGNSVDIGGEIASLRGTLNRLQHADRAKMENAIEDAETELAKPEPDRDEVGRALHRALHYAQKAGGFIEIAGDLVPTVTRIAAWLGKNWHGILDIVGLLA